MARDVRLIISGNASGAEQAIANLQRSGVTAASVLEREFSQLGTRSSLVFDNQRRAAETAYQRIKTSGMATADEIRRADVAYKARLEEIRRSQEGVSDSTMGMKTAWSAFVGVLAASGISSFVSNMVAVRVEVDKVKASLGTTFGERAGEEFSFVAAESERLGLALNATAIEYGRLAAASKGTSLEGETTRKIFVGITEAGTALGLSQSEMSGALNAVQQMMSKGKVQAEELRGQLGERLPGAFQLAAKAMGVTDAELNKMLDDGEVLASDLLPRLAELLHDQFGKAAMEASDGVNASLNRLETSWQTLLTTASQRLPIADSIGIATEAVKLLADNLDTAAIGFTTMAAATGTQLIISNIGAITAAVKGLSTSTALATGGLSLLLGASAMLAYEGGQALHNYFSGAQETAGAMEMMASHSTAAAKTIAQNTEELTKKEKRELEKRIKETEKHNDRILEIEKDRLKKSLQQEEEHLQEVTRAYETAANDLASLIDTKLSVQKRLSARDAEDAIKEAFPLDPLNDYLAKQGEIENAEREIDSAFSMSAEEKARAYVDLIDKAAGYNRAVHDGSVEIVSAYQTEYAYQTVKERLQNKINTLIDAEENKRFNAAVTMAEQMIVGQDLAARYRGEIESIESLLDKINHKEVNINFKASGIDEIYTALAGLGIPFVGGGGGGGDFGDDGFVGPPSSGQALVNYGDYYTYGGKTYWADGSLADEGTGFVETWSPSGVSSISYGGQTMSFGSDPNAPFGSYGFGFAVGTSYVPRTGLYQLHRGEEVLTRTEKAAKSESSQVSIVNNISIDVPNVKSIDAGSAREFANILAPEIRRIFDEKFRKQSFGV